VGVNYLPSQILDQKGRQVGVCLDNCFVGPGRMGEGGSLSISMTYRKGGEFTMLQRGKGCRTVFSNNGYTTGKKQEGKDDVKETVCLAGGGRRNFSRGWKKASFLVGKGSKCLSLREEKSRRPPLKQ